MHILIAEDDTLIQQGLADLLTKEGYQVSCANDGEQAMSLYQAARPQLVLLDIMMPYKDGYQVCREIRQLDESVPIIFLSAKSEEIDKVVGLELGADDYIAKPFGTREVIARIRAVTRRFLRSQQSTQTQFKLGDLCVYPQELRAKRDNDTIELSLRDVKILELLSQHKHQVVTRDQLFDYCWGRDYLPSSRTLDQHISKLRKSIEVDPKQPQVIVTVHGVGYRCDC